MEGKQRLFFAFSLPPKVHEACEQFRQAHRELAIRWIPQDNLHITLLFLGSTEGALISEVARTGSMVAQQGKADSLHFTKFDWAPPSRGRSPLRRGEGPPSSTPGMIWLYAQPSPYWTDIKTQLRDALSREGVYRGTDERDFHGHVTLSRFEPRPRKSFAEITTPFRFEYHPTELLLMESKLSSKGATYTIRDRFTFAKQS